MRKLERHEVKFERKTEAEDMPIKGNVSAVDPETDLQAETEIEDRLSRGDDSAWCVLVVHATWKGFKGVATLGGYIFPKGNSGEKDRYAEPDFRQLEDEALEDLNESLRKTGEKLKELQG